MELEYIILLHLVRIEHLLKQILTEEKIMKAEIDALTAQVKANTDAEQSAVLLINGIADRITAAAGDPKQVKALTEQLKASATTLAAAVAANTQPA